LHDVAPALVEPPPDGWPGVRRVDVLLPNGNRFVWTSADPVEYVPPPSPPPSKDDRS
jgi:hypothetical protein